MPFSRFLFGGRVPLFEIDHRNKGTPILTSLPEDLVNDHFQRALVVAYCLSFLLVGWFVEPWIFVTSLVCSQLVASPVCLLNGLRHFEENTGSGEGQIGCSRDLSGLVLTQAAGEHSSCPPCCEHFRGWAWQLQEKNSLGVV